MHKKYHRERSASIFHGRSYYNVLLAGLALTLGCKPVRIVPLTLATSQAQEVKNGGFGLIGDIETDKQVLKALNVTIGEDGTLSDSISKKALVKSDVLSRLKALTATYRSDLSDFLVDAAIAEKIERQMIETVGAHAEVDVAERTFDVTALLRKIAKPHVTDPKTDPWDSATAQFKIQKAVVQHYIAALDMQSQLSEGSSADYDIAMKQVNATGAVLAIGSIQHAQQQWLKADKKRGDWMAFDIRAPRFAAYGGLVFDNAEAKPADILEKSSAQHRSSVLTKIPTEGERVERLQFSRATAADAPMKVGTAYVESMDAVDDKGELIRSGPQLTTDGARAAIFRTVKGRRVVSDFDVVVARYSEKTQYLSILNADQTGALVIQKYSKAKGYVSVSAAEVGFMEAQSKAALQSGIVIGVKHGSEAAHDHDIVGGGPDSVSLSVISSGKATSHQRGQFTSYVQDEIADHQKVFASQTALTQLFKKRVGASPSDIFRPGTLGAVVSIGSDDGIRIVRAVKSVSAGTFNASEASFSHLPEESLPRATIPSSPRARKASVTPHSPTHR